jgi:hypothetical protein
MNFILPFSVKKTSEKISIRKPMLLMGSCFAEEIDKKLSERKFDVKINPHGILYNPISISNAITEYIQDKKYNKSDIFFHEELWRSFSHHGKFSNPDKKACLQNINKEIEQAHHQLKKAHWLVVTFGSAFAYTHKNKIVANCHKISANQFNKVLLTKEEIIETWQQQIEVLKQFNPSLKILFTVSPVRYIRDGLIENNRSKGILIDAVHSLIEKNTNCFYFPAYEIVIDELRDYRFFKEDLVHPNELAINYVWKKFASACFDEETIHFISDYEPILKSLQHRNLQGETSASLSFQKHLEEKQNALKEKYPFIQ